MFFAYHPTDQSIELAAKSVSLANQASKGRPLVVQQAQRADIELLKAHLPFMDEESKDRAHSTISAINAGFRTYEAW